MVDNLPYENQPIPPPSLPNELWDLIFHHLSDDLLLALAAVSRGFNELAIGAYLLRHGVSADSIEEGNLDIPCGVLVALQLLCRTPPLERIRCTFSGNSVCRRLHRLRNIVSTFPDLRELHIEFPPGFFNSYTYYVPVTASSGPMIAALRDVLYTMGTKANGPIVVLHSQQLLKYTLQDVASWQLPRFSARLVLVPDMPHAALGPRVETGSSDFSSVSVWSIHVRSEPLGSCIILVPGPPIVALDLGGWGWGAQNALTSAEITAILPHVNLSHLRNIRIETGDIDPATLGSFLSRHPKISSLSYEPSEILHRSSAALISPPIAHPGLTKISVKARTEHLVPLLGAVAPSPLLSEIMFPYNRDATSSVVARIAVRTTESNLSLRIEGRNTRALDAEERGLARSLNNVHQIEFECRSFESARTMFAWLALLPALRCLDFKYMTKRRGSSLDAAIAQFVDEVREALPRAVEVYMHADY